MIKWGILQIVLNDNFSIMLKAFYQTDCWAIYYLKDNIFQVIVLQIANIFLSHITTLEQLYNISDQIVAYEALSIYSLPTINLACRLAPLPDYNILQQGRNYFPTLHSYLAEIIPYYKNNNLLTYFNPPHNIDIKQCKINNPIHDAWAQQQLQMLFNYYSMDKNIGLLCHQITQYQKLIRQIKEGFITDNIATYFAINNSNVWVAEKGKDIHKKLTSLHEQLHNVDKDNIIVDLTVLDNFCITKNDSPVSPTMTRTLSPIFSNLATNGNYKISDPTSNSTSLLNSNGKYNIIINQEHVITQGGNNYTIQQLDHNIQLLLLQYLQDNNLFPLVQQEIVNILGSK